MQYTDVLITVVMSNLNSDLVIDMVLLIKAGCSLMVMFVALCQELLHSC